MSFLHLSSNMCWFGSDVCFYNIAMIIVSRKACQCQCICSLCNWELFILPLVTLVFIVIVYSYLLSWIQSPFLISALTMFSSLQKIQFCWKFICSSSFLLKSVIINDRQCKFEVSFVFKDWQKRYLSWQITYTCLKHQHWHEKYDHYVNTLFLLLKYCPKH